MKKKMFALSLLILSMSLYASISNAQYDEVTVWTNKAEYAPGEKGALYIAFYNNRDEAVAIKNVTITYYNWLAYIDGEWVGNETRTMDVPVSGKSTKLINDVVEGDITFTVPTDGRAVTTYVRIQIGTDKGFEYGSATINVQEPTPRYMEQITTLFTVQVVLIIVCTIIIAATIFLSMRRPQVTWKAEEKEE
ncbi:MAG: hypothetical protein QW270_04785 [Candidatus Bathyarchaeia archaeon]